MAMREQQQSEFSQEWDLFSAWAQVDSLVGEYQMIASKGDKQYNLQFRVETENWQFTE